MKISTLYTPRLLLAAILIAASAISHAFQIGNFNFNILSEEERTVDIAWRYNDAEYDENILEIPETVTFEGKEYTVTEVREHGFVYEGYYHRGNPFKNLLRLPPSIRKIGECGFFGSRFKDVEIPDSVLVDDCAFDQCFYIEKLSLGRGCTIGPAAFEYNVKATELVLPSGTIVEAGAPFFVWNNLKKLELAADVKIFPPAGFGYFPTYYDPNYYYYPSELWELSEQPLTVIYHTSTPQYIDGVSPFRQMTYDEGVLYMEDEEGVRNARNTFPWSQFKNILPLSVNVEVQDIPDNESPDPVPEQLFTLNGTSIATPREALSPGIYIIRQGPKTSKIIIP